MKLTKRFWNDVLVRMENMADLRMIVSLNDTGDILVRLKPTKEYL